MEALFLAHDARRGAFQLSPRGPQPKRNKIKHCGPGKNVQEFIRPKYVCHFNGRFGAREWSNVAADEINGPQIGGPGVRTSFVKSPVNPSSRSGPFQFFSHIGSIQNLRYSPLEITIDPRPDFPQSDFIHKPHRSRVMFTKKKCIINLLKFTERFGGAIKLKGVFN